MRSVAKILFGSGLSGLSALQKTNGKDHGAIENLEKPRNRFSKKLGHLSPTLPKNEAWVRSTIENRLFKSIDIHNPFSPKELETFKKNYENKYVNPARYGQSMPLRTPITFALDSLSIIYCLRRPGKDGR